MSCTFVLTVRQPSPPTMMLCENYHSFAVRQVQFPKSCFSMDIHTVISQEGRTTRRNRVLDEPGVFGRGRPRIRCWRSSRRGSVVPTGLGSKQSPSESELLDLKVRCCFVLAVSASLRGYSNTTVMKKLLQLCGSSPRRK